MNSARVRSLHRAEGALHITASSPLRSRTTTLEDHDSPLPHREEDPPWTTDDANELYMIERWGSGYFGVNTDGNLTVAPLQDIGAKIPILDVVNEALEEGLQTPLLIRFQDILHHRVRTINEAFNHAIVENKYQGAYRGVFPIKVNQLREVVEEILAAGEPFHYGLEVGSKPELFAGLAELYGKAARTAEVDQEGCLVWLGRVGWFGLVGLAGCLV